MLSIYSSNVVAVAIRYRPVIWTNPVKDFLILLKSLRRIVHGYQLTSIFKTRCWKSINRGKMNVTLLKYKMYWITIHAVWIECKNWVKGIRIIQWSQVSTGIPYNYHQILKCQSILCSLYLNDHMSHQVKCLNYNMSLRP